MGWGWHEAGGLWSVQLPVSWVVRWGVTVLWTKGRGCCSSGVQDRGRSFSSMPRARRVCQLLHAWVHTRTLCQHGWFLPGLTNKRQHVFCKLQGAVACSVLVCICYRHNDPRICVLAP